MPNFTLDLPFTHDAALTALQYHGDQRAQSAQYRAQKSAREAVFAESLRYLQAGWQIFPTQPAQHKKPYFAAGATACPPVNMGTAQQLFLDSGCGIGLRTGVQIPHSSNYLIGIDLDFHDQAAIQLMRTYLDQLPGIKVVKVGNKGFTQFVRMAAPLESYHYAFETNGQKSPDLLEILGRDVDMHGVPMLTTPPPSRAHDDRSYYWQSAALLDVKPTHLPLMTEAQFAAMARILGNHMALNGAAPKIIKVNGCGSGKSTAWCCDKPDASSQEDCNATGGSGSTGGTGTTGDGSSGGTGSTGGTTGGSTGGTTTGGNSGGSTGGTGSTGSSGGTTTGGTTTGSSTGGSTSSTTTGGTTSTGTGTTTTGTTTTGTTTTGTSTGGGPFTGSTGGGATASLGNLPDVNESCD